MMKMLAAAAALALTCAAGAATAETAFAEATLAQPLTKPTQVIAGGAVWSCDASSCSAPATSDRTLSVSACKQLVKEAGKINTYRVDRHALTADEVAKCNAVKS